MPILSSERTVISILSSILIYMNATLDVKSISAGRMLHEALVVYNLPSVAYTSLSNIHDSIPS
jgi:hypothetical protein